MAKARPRRWSFFAAPPSAVSSSASPFCGRPRPRPTSQLGSAGTRWVGKARQERGGVCSNPPAGGALQNQTTRLDSGPLPKLGTNAPSSPSINSIPGQRHRVRAGGPQSQYSYPTKAEASLACKPFGDLTGLAVQAIRCRKLISERTFWLRLISTKNLSPITTFSVTLLMCYPPDPITIATPRQ